jgi:hypothetical protein
LDETFSGFGPMKNLKAKVTTRAGKLKVADLAKDEIVAVLNPTHFPSFRQLLQGCLEMNPDDTTG